MNCYTHLTIEEREILLAGKIEGKSICEIARILSRSPSTVSRELKRNQHHIKDRYSPSRAQAHYAGNRKNCKRTRKLERQEIRDKVERMLEEYWSPEQISGRLKKENNSIQISTSTIYRGFRQGMIAHHLTRKLRRKGRHLYKSNKSNMGHLDKIYSIHDRPESINARTEIGHWESDTVRGAKHSGCVATHVERKSRYCVLLKIPDRTANSLLQATLPVFERLPSSHVRSFTVDNGKEFACHKEMMSALGCKVYFADPGAPDQRGTNENTNGLLRQFLPKRTSFRNLNQSDVDSLADLLNSRPRKCLNFSTPFEVFFDSLLHLT